MHPALRRIAPRDVIGVQDELVLLALLRNLDASRIDARKMRRAQRSSDGRAGTDDLFSANKTCSTNINDRIASLTVVAAVRPVAHVLGFLFDEGRQLGRDRIYIAQSGLEGIEAGAGAAQNLVYELLEWYVFRGRLVRVIRAVVRGDLCWVRGRHVVG